MSVSTRGGLSGGGRAAKGCCCPMDGGLGALASSEEAAVPEPQEEGEASVLGASTRSSS